MASEGDARAGEGEGEVGGVTNEEEERCKGSKVCSASMGMQEGVARCTMDDAG